MDLIQINRERFGVLCKAEANALVAVVIVTGSTDDGIPLGFVLCAKKVSDASGFASVALSDLPHFDADYVPPVGPGVWVWTLHRDRPRTRDWRRLRRQEETLLCDEGAERLCNALIDQVVEADRS